jgi:hypothetical protein
MRLYLRIASSVTMAFSGASTLLTWTRQYSAADA